MKNNSYTFLFKTNYEFVYAVALGIFCNAILAARFLHTGSHDYLFLSFNLILAWIPYFVSFLIKRTNKEDSIFLKSFYFVIWLLFFPNAPYILTDLFHLQRFKNMPMWYDLLMVISFSWCGLVVGFYSVRNVQQRFFANRSLAANILFVLSIFFLAGIGIYLGRYERWNSWDILFDFNSILLRSSEILNDTGTLKYIFSMAVLYCGVLSFMYLKFVFVRNKGSA